MHDPGRPKPTARACLPEEHVRLELEECELNFLVIVRTAAPRKGSMSCSLTLQPPKLLYRAVREHSPLLQIRDLRPLDSSRRLRHLGLHHGMPEGGIKQNERQNMLLIMPNHGDISRDVRALKGGTSGAIGHIASTAAESTRLHPVPS